MVYRIFGTVAFLSSLLAFWQRWLIAGLWFLFFFLLFFFFFEIKKKKKKEKKMSLGDFSKKKKSMGLK